MGDKVKLDGIVQFSHFFVVGFLRIENLHSFLLRKRKYALYTKIPNMLLEYLKSKTKEEKIENITGNLNNLSNSLYKESWDKMIDYKHIKNSDYSEKNTIDKLNKFACDICNIKDKDFFSSINNILAKNIKYKDESIPLKEFDIFIEKYIEINKMIKNNSTKDLQICMAIATIEFSNFLHHIYIAYYRDIKKQDNLIKSKNHLERANRDMNKAIMLNNPSCTTLDIKNRLQEIYQTGIE